MVDQAGWKKIIGDKPTLIMLDELPPYLENASTTVIGGGTLATVSTYTLSCLMSAALELPRCCIVIANLSGSYVAQTKAIAEAISNLQQEASRQASTITPVQLAGTCSSLAPLRLDAGRFSLASRFDLPKYRRLHCPQSFRPGCYRPRLSG